MSASLATLKLPVSQEPSFFQELKRRNVFRVAIGYVVLAWLVMQVADVVLNNISAPGWVFQALLLFLALGLPFAIFFSWAFELTPEGLKRESEVDRSQSIAHHTGKKLDRVVIGILVLALGYFMLDKFVLSAGREEAAVVAALEQAAAVTAPAGAAVENVEDKSIAVLPFVNMSSDPEQEYFSDGLSEELLNLLAKIPELQVAARTSAFSFKGKDLKIDEVAKELGVAHVLEGSVRTSGNRIRVTAQLIRADNGFHLWSETYNRTLDDVFTIQDEIAGAVVDSLKITLLGEAPHVATTTPEAYALYLQARHFSNQLTNETFDKAIDMYKRVIELDPDYAPAWAGLSRNYRNKIASGQLTVEEGLELAHDAVTRAIELDPELAEAHARLALLQLENFDQPTEAALSYRRALELSPNDPSAQLGLANFHRHLKELDKALRFAEKAVQLDPVDALIHLELSEIYTSLGRNDDALDSLHTAVNLSPELNRAHYEIGIEYLLRNKPDEAEKYFTLEPDEEYTLKGHTLVAHARGDEERFEKLLQQLIDEFGEVWPSEIAHVYAWTGDPDTAFEWLDKAIAIDEGGIEASHRIRLLDPLHGDPRWEAYLQQLNISDAQLKQISQDIGWD